MPTQHLNVASFDGDLCRIDLTYDDVTLGVSGVHARNLGTNDAWIEVQNGVQHPAGILPANTDATVALPAGLITLQQVTGPNGDVLSCAPWSITTRYPA